ncbi:SUMF1/EgtB/PvdO family nonheme iron enzyme [Pseudomonas sp. Fl5BN2]|uniref:formylglycine-generating enzyme family protein n=1 Tax=Pseudomonas sp. Fl5BN2 TaxID=2697652 RepID=UPI00137690B3|nr:SUMF1/EgtB/PvdO family nonheme iron enzyme [Pseudomonas sp. Fl5BN2]NBF02269.1 SUMF1/EgtB/PvdO family nonheme iron enzyme [Pseudomonas sp. Fl5BN2]
MKSKGFAHWPRFDGPLTTDMTDRQLMGLAEHFQPGIELSLPLAVWRQLSDKSAEQLAQGVENPDSPLSWRLASARLLAQTMDPRLDVLNPPMINIEGGQVEIGLQESRVEQVMRNMQGLGLDRGWIEKEVPRHSVELKPYAIGKYPVTNLEYRAFLEDSRHPNIPSNWPFGQFPRERANHPVYGLNATDADAYVQWLSTRTGRSFRLPTEAEWEFAAAGHENLEFPWGDSFLPLHANTAELGLFTTTAVGALAQGASPFGCMDMAGNVEEYVADDYAPYPGGKAITDDLVTVVGAHRIARGGSFTRFRDLARNCRRHGKYPREIYVMGFRLAESL